MLDTDFERFGENFDIIHPLSDEERELEIIVDKIKSMGTLQAIVFLDRLLKDQYKIGFAYGRHTMNNND